MIFYNILGDCVSRDIVTPLIENNEAKVLQYSSFSSPISMLSAKPEIEIEDEDLIIQGNNFVKRCSKFDFNKQCLDYVFSNKADYLIFDILDARISLLKKDNHFITLNNYTKKLFPTLNQKFRKDKYKEISPFDDIDKETWTSVIERMCDMLLYHYDSKRIILFKHFGAEQYFDKNGGLCSFTSTLKYCKKCNNLVSDLFAICENKLSGCHIIDFPEYVTADAGNIWGLHFLHYQKEFYEYGAEALRIISKNYDLFEEKIRLENLRKQFSDKFELMTRIGKLNTRLKQFSNALNFTEKLCNDMISNKRFIHFIENCKVQHSKVVVLKCNDAAGRVLVNALESNNVEILLKSPHEAIQSLTEEQRNLCKQATMIISANIHSFFKLNFDGRNVISIADIIK